MTAMSYPPTYTIATISDLFNVVNTNNIDRVVVDLNHMLYVIAKMKENVGENANVILPPSYQWVDDGVVNANITFTVSIGRGLTPRS